MTEPVSVHLIVTEEGDLISEGEPSPEFSVHVSGHTATITLSQESVADGVAIVLGQGANVAFLDPLHLTITTPTSETQDEVPLTNHHYFFPPLGADPTTIIFHQEFLSGSDRRPTHHDPTIILNPPT